jgi:hypothetical protein
LTQWPKTIGCETFIIVALTCSENITPVLRASPSVFVELQQRFLLMNMLSMISPACSATFGLSTMVWPLW